MTQPPRPQPAQPQKPSRAIWYVVGSVVVLALVVGIGRVVGADDGSSTAVATSTPVPSRTTASAPPVAPAAYELREDGRRLTMLVSTDDTKAIRQAFDQLADNVVTSRPDGGYHVAIDCAIGYDPDKAANRLGTGKIAVGQLGAAQTGLARAGMSSIDWNTGRTCRPDAAPKTFDPSRQLDGPYALELCRGRVEEKYVADQRPVTIVATPQQTATGWTVSGTAQGKASGPTPNAIMTFTCEVSDNPLRSAVTRFDS